MSSLGKALLYYSVRFSALDLNMLYPKKPFNYPVMWKDEPAALLT